MHVCVCVYSVLILAGLYLNLGPTGFRLLLDQDTIQLDEQQIYNCAFIWLLVHPSAHLPPPTGTTTMAGIPKHLLPPIVLDSPRDCSSGAVATAGQNHRKSQTEALQKMAEVAKERTNKTKEGSSDSIFGNVYIWEFLSLMKWRAPSKPQQRVAVARALLGGIRFCSMSAEQMRDLRLTYLDSFLLDAMLRKSFGIEMKARVFPWKANSEFVTKCYGGLFPVTLCRRSGGSGAKAADREDWAWTSGHPRMVNEALWAIEVCRSSCGLNIGVCTEQPGVGQPNLQMPGRSSSSPFTSCTFYFNCQERTFYTGQLGTNPRVVTYRMSHRQCANRDWSKTIAAGDIVLVRVTVGYTNLRLSVAMLGGDYRQSVEHNFPHACQLTTVGAAMPRACLRLCPYLECLGSNDIYGVPELQTHTPGSSSF
eukprot:GHVS01043938.1.p1 GENE.GHVS01043938.1~~GHVS01043938.1.p1  ORF type:complete len:422 (+),score=54.52 GHVS01043938.1:96-1361(+)